MEVHHMTGVLSPAGAINGALSSAATLDGSLTIEPSAVELYGGPFEFTPTASSQTINISGKTAQQDITINPIPSNYGLITWSGLGIRIS